MKLKLPDVTLICVDCANVGAALSSMQKTLRQIQPHKAILITDRSIKVEGIQVEVIDPIKSKDEYSRFIVKELWKYIETSHCLVVQHDSWVLDASVWDDEWLKLDYIGATWGYTDGRNVGNGGGSIRSKKLQVALAKDPSIEIVSPEDEIIGRLYRGYLEKNYGIKFATEQQANRFSFECNEPVGKTFMFHSFFHPPYKEHVLIKRTAALGDVVMAEPLIDYYHKKGYQVVLDTLPEFMPIFSWHPFRIKHISQMNPKIKPVKEINLDMSYESKPKQLVLKTYYEFAGIEDGEIRNSRLYVKQEPHQRLFQKYIVLHIDDTGMAHRNAHGIAWDFIVAYFQKLGYFVVQIGKRTKQVVATHFNAETKEMLLFLLNGADLVIGLDSGVCQLSVALGVPTVIFFGSVNPKLRYPDFSNIEVIQAECEDEQYKHCYHSQEGSTTGVKCIFNNELPPCTKYETWDIIRAANKLLKQ